MKIKVTQQTEIEIELQLPAFYKSSAYWYKVLSDNEYICVGDYTNSVFEIRLNKNAPLMINYIINNEQNKPCTEQEFIEAYMDTKNAINDMLPDVEETDKLN